MLNFSSVICIFLVYAHIRMMNIVCIDINTPNAVVLRGTMSNNEMTF